jgi:hypothetical protein
MDDTLAFPGGKNRFDGRVAEGMTLRDWFAGQALTGLIAQTPHRCFAAGFAHDAYCIADAMLAARSGKGGLT